MPTDTRTPWPHFTRLAEAAAALYEAGETPPPLAEDCYAVQTRLAELADNDAALRSRVSGLLDLLERYARQNGQYRERLRMIACSVELDFARQLAAKPLEQEGDDDAPGD